MKYKEITLERLIVVGISVRTNNNPESQGNIATLWSNFLSNNIVSKIENKISDNVYCIYTEYENDYTGDYTTIIGCAVSSIENLPNGWKTIEIDTGKYLEFTSEGQLPSCVLNTWQHIWDNDYNRAYKADFDVYGAESADPMNAKVNTYLSIL